MAKAEAKEDPAVTKFREYLRIKTVEPEPDYGMYPHAWYINIDYLFTSY